jgi:hypothetical protein
MACSRGIVSAALICIVIVSTDVELVIADESRPVLVRRVFDLIERQGTCEANLRAGVKQLSDATRKPALRHGSSVA